MKIRKFHKRVFILGLGISGLSLANLLSKISNTIFCWDDDIKKREKVRLKKKILKDYKSIDFSKIDYLVLSPIINHKIKKPHEAVKKAISHNVKIISDIEFIEILKIDNHSIGITGTNGKSTTTKFVEETLSKNLSSNSLAFGNIGLPFAQIIPKIKKNTNLIIELSSFQLDKIDKLKLDIAILLNISNDHLDWHQNKKKYVDAKLKIFKNQHHLSYSLICVDDKECMDIARNFGKFFKSKLIMISTEKILNNGIYSKRSSEGVEIINSINSTKFFLPFSKLKFTIAKHNLQNLLVTYAVNFLMNVNNEDFCSSTKELKNLEHRIEFAGSLKNIDFYNDSKSTNVASAKTAIDSFKNIFWILGGRKKSGGLNEISSKLKNVMKCYVFGESRTEFHEFLSKKSYPSKSFEYLKTALDTAIKDALKEKKKINILFSPACSSYDQFNNFDERGKLFKKCVKERILHG